MHLTLGVAAHVDAGKTTLCEQLLAHAGVLRRPGRVDHGDTFMDGHAIERARGITIFCEQASFDLPRGDGALHVTLMDTPGHVDFLGEAERALSVLDMALLVVSCAEGVQSHTVTLFRLLRARRIPTMIFLNKADRAEPALALLQLGRLLSADCVDMAQEADALREALAERDDALLEAHLEDAAQPGDYLAGARRAMAAGKLFPVLSGSALEDRGVDALLEAIAALADTPYDNRRDEPFAGLVYRVRRQDGVRYAYVKALAGTLRVRGEVRTAAGMEKVNALCLPQGTRLVPLAQLEAGQTAAVAGLSARPGMYVGARSGEEAHSAAPLMSVDVEPLGALDNVHLLAHLRELEEEDPLLRVRAGQGRVSVGIMGAVQTEVLGSVLESRFGDRVAFRPPQVIYRETIAAPVVGIGHYEPLRHYAEVWLELLPGAPGSGVTFEAACPPNTLEVNWQRLIGTHVLERAHPGVLTGSALTDVRVRLIAGRAHLKHTEGGDFREATYRAIRHALMQAHNVLLEPMVRFELAVEQQALPRVTGELIRLGAQMDAPEMADDEARMTGVCTAAAFWDYPQRFAATTRGRGRIAMAYSHHAPCGHQEEIVRAIGYDPLADEQNPTGSVFCSHGAGFAISWEHVREWAHCEEGRTCSPAR